ncbi:hypothetical protein [Thermodesulfatator atlanticus]|uniref:hypothetical protein n=1 Tax=Thermodesulfatator atlanticus TaxID=501497 RepID=UPI0003B33419|nr:hypothetical protein [Thermodesulfatator atlanticus]
MKLLTYAVTLAGIFWFYEFFAFLWKPLPFDPFLPVLVGFYFWRLKPIYYWGGVFLTGLVVDAFSSTIPGPAVFAYLISLAIFLQFYRKLALRGFLPAFLSLIFVISFGVLARLLIFPALFEVPLPEKYLWDVLKYLIGTFIWGVCCWSFCQISFMRYVFELPTNSKS